MRWMTLGLMCCVAMPAWAARPLSYEEAVDVALQRNPSVRNAVATAEKAGHDVTSANGQYDPVLSLDGGWNRSLSLDRFGNFPDPFAVTSDGWNVNMNLSATAPTGTSATFQAGLAESTATISLQDDGDPSILDAIFGDAQEQKSFRPTFRLSLAQELLKGVILGYNLQNVRRAKSGQTLAELEVERTRQQAIADVGNAYWNWVYVDQLAQIAREAVVVAEENLRVGAAKVEVGQAAPMERTRLEAALVQARTSAIDADNNAASTRDGLLLLMGEVPGQDVSPSSAPGSVPPLQVDASRAVAVALEQSVELRVQRQRVEDARRELAMARHARLPSLTANVSGALQGFDDTAWEGAFVLYESMLPSISVGATLSVPLGGRATTGTARKASAELQAQEALLAELDAKTRADVEQQVRVLSSAAQKVELADVNVRLAQETLAAEQSLHEVGRALLKDVLEAQASLDRALGEAVRARTDFRVAEVQLLRLQGQLLPPRP